MADAYFKLELNYPWKNFIVVTIFNHATLNNLTTYNKYVRQDDKIELIHFHAVYLQRQKSKTFSFSGILKWYVFLTFEETNDCPYFVNLFIVRRL